MVLHSLERRLERMVDSVFSRAPRNSVKPIELGRRLIRILDEEAEVDARGRRVVPNGFHIDLSVADFEGFQAIAPILRAELADAVKEYARDENYFFLGPVVVDLACADHLRPGRFEVTADLRPARGGPGRAAAVLKSGQRVELGQAPAVIGRVAECQIVIGDSNVSRRHAQIVPVAEGWQITDLGSTNGTSVNGAKLTGPRYLSDGDTITVAGNPIRFELS